MIEELLNMVKARYALVGIETYEEGRLMDYIHASCDDRTIWTWSITDGLARESLSKKDGVKTLTSDSVAETEDYNAVLVHIKKEIVANKADEKAIIILKDFHPAFESAIIRRHLRDLSISLTHTRTTIFLVSPTLEIPSDLEKAISVIEFPLPNEEEMLRLVQACHHNNKAKFKKKVLSDEMTEVARASLGLTVYEADTSLAKAVAKHGRFELQEIADQKKQILRKSGLEIYEPDIAMEDLGGLEILKDYLNQVFSAMEDPQATLFGVPPAKGVLLLSSPGNAKSALAKAIAKKLKRVLVRFDPGAMMGSLVGESEKNMRKAMSRIETINRCILWVDEIEKAMPKDVGTGDSGTAKRMFGSFLTWLQENKSEAYCVFTANDIRPLPPELMRAGRIDSIWYIDLPTVAQRSQILGIHLKKRKRSGENLCLTDVAGVTENFSGAELEQVVINSIRASFHDGKRDLRDSDLITAAKEIVPIATTMKEEIEGLRTWAKTRARFASRPEGKGKRTLASSRTL